MSKIEWTDRTWNPVTGCSEISEGCKNCFARRMARRLKAMCQAKYKNGFKVTCHPESLDEPLKWKKPKKIFICSMGDLFHEDVPFEFINEIFYTIQDCPHHVFQILTKRPERMLKYFKEFGPPLPNVWLGVTVVNQPEANEKIPVLLRTPAAVRFVSIEPMLGAIEFDDGHYSDCDLYNGWGCDCDTSDKGWLEMLDWVIVGGESGSGARPMHSDWARDVIKQCKEAGISVFFKQWGEWLPSDYRSFEEVQKEKHKYTGVARDDIKPLSADKIRMMYRIGKAKAGSLLDGKEYKEFPE